MVGCATFQIQGMAMLIELFGEEVFNLPLEEVKRKIRALPPVQQERRSYLMHEWQVITGQKLTERDYLDVE